MGEEKKTRNFLHTNVLFFFAFTGKLLKIVCIHGVLYLYKFFCSIRWNIKLKCIPIIDSVAAFPKKQIFAMYPPRHGKIFFWTKAIVKYWEFLSDFDAMHRQFCLSYPTE